MATSPESDQELIDAELALEKLVDLKAQARFELEREDITPARREAAYALLRQIARRGGYSDTRVFSGGVWRERESGQ